MNKKSNIPLKQRKKIAVEKFITQNPEYYKEYNKKTYLENREILLKRRKEEYHRNKERYKQRYKENRETLLLKAKEQRIKKKERAEYDKKRYDTYQDTLWTTFSDIMNKFWIWVTKTKALLQKFTYTEIMKADSIDSIKDLIYLDYNY